MTNTWQRAATAFGVAALLSFPAGAARADTLLGVYEGGQGWKMDRVRAMEAWQGKRHAVVNLFTNWCDRAKSLNDLFGQQLPNVWNSGNVPMVTWEPYLCSPAATPANVETLAAGGAYRSYVDAWARRMKQFLAGPDAVYGTGDDRRAYLRLGHEMNGDWYPWGGAQGNNPPDDWKAMWGAVRDVFAQHGIEGTRLQWVWSVNHTDVGPYRAEDYYPGDAQVDWLAIDGYNWGASQSWSSWNTPAGVFDDMLARVRALAPGKPVAITETASSSDVGATNSVADKQAWIGAFFDYAQARALGMVVWFNEDKETDWAVFGGTGGDGSVKVGRTTYRTYSAYRQRVAGSAWLVPAAATPRLLTDAQFAGAP